MLPKRLRHTLTVDNGKEFSHFKDLERALDIDLYFAEPYCPCRRAINENTNGLLRQTLPKKTCFKGLTQNELKTYIDKLNNRPRKKLGYRTPAEVFRGLLHVDFESTDQRNVTVGARILETRRGRNNIRQSPSAKSTPSAAGKENTKK